MADTALPIIQQQRMLVDRLRASLAVEEQKLEGMELIYATMPKPKEGRIVKARVITRKELAEGAGSGGRQPGAISKRWRRILGELYFLDAPFTPEGAAQMVLQLENRQLKPSEAKRILEGYEGYDYVIRDNAGMFVVTEEAAAKFGFTKSHGVKNTSDDFDDLLEVPPPPAPRAVSAEGVVTAAQLAHDTIERRAGESLRLTGKETTSLASRAAYESVTARVGEISRTAQEEYRIATAHVGDRYSDILGRRS